MGMNNIPALSIYPHSDELVKFNPHSSPFIPIPDFIQHAPAVFNIFQAILFYHPVKSASNITLNAFESATQSLQMLFVISYHLLPQQ